MEIYKPIAEGKENFFGTMFNISDIDLKRYVRFCENGYIEVCTKERGQKPIWISFLYESGKVISVDIGPWANLSYESFTFNLRKEPVHKAMRAIVSKILPSVYFEAINTANNATNSFKILPKEILGYTLSFLKQSDKNNLALVCTCLRNAQNAFYISTGYYPGVIIEARKMVCKKWGPCLKISHPKNFVTEHERNVTNDNMWRECDGPARYLTDGEYKNILKSVAPDLFIE